MVRETRVAPARKDDVDIEGIELNSALKELVGKVRSDDPFITGVRVGQYTANTVRLVLDLRQMVLPQVFNLSPVEFTHLLAFFYNNLVSKSIALTFCRLIACLNLRAY